RAAAGRLGRAGAATAGTPADGFAGVLALLLGGLELGFEPRALGLVLDAGELILELGLFLLRLFELALQARELFLSGGALGLESSGLLLGFGDVVAVDHAAADHADQEQGADRADDHLELLLPLILVQERQLLLVGLLRGHRLQPGLVLGLRLGFLDLPLADGLEARGLFLAALLLRPACVFFLTQAALLGFACGALRRGLRLGLGASPGFLLLFLRLDPVFLKVHELLEREENRAFFLFGHERCFLGGGDPVGAGDYWLTRSGAPVAD